MANEAAVAEPPVAAAPVEPARKSAPEPKRPTPKHAPTYAVVVENDEDHTFEYVEEVLQRVCRCDLKKAHLLAVVIDAVGEAAVWTGSLEVAELKRDQIRGFGPDFYARRTVRYPLGVRLEPMPS